MLDQTHDAGAKSWVDDANGHPDFPVQNLPLGIFDPGDGRPPRGGVAIGDHILDLGVAAALMSGEARQAAEAADAPHLNAVLGMGRNAHRALRHAIFALLTDAAHAATMTPMLHARQHCRMHLPVTVSNYTDFYTGIHHAENVGRLFRPDNPLLPNYKYVPIGYHGRSSSVRVSGEPVRRPRGQTRAPDAAAPEFGPARRLDYELEMAIWVGQGNPLGAPIPISEAASHIAGLSLLNDWSARDIQAWEYQPLGPFLSKNFHTSVSPWIVTADALEPYRLPPLPRPDGDPLPLPYLTDPADQAAGAYNVVMEVFLRTAPMRARGLAPHRLSRGNMTDMYWTAAQLITHHSANGCNLCAGDLLGTGTLSGPRWESFGSLLELSYGGKQPILLPDGEERTFLEDGDELIMTASAETEGHVRIGFGECQGMVVGS